MAGPCPHSWKSVYVQRHVGCGTLTGDGLTKYIQNDTNEWETQSLEKNNWFEIKNKTEDRGQSIPKSIGTLTVLICIFGPNLEILNAISGDLSRIQTHKLKWGKFWLWSEIWPWRSRSIIPQNNTDLNLGLLHLWSKFVILAWKGDDLSRGQTWWRTDWRMDGQTDRRTDAGSDNTWRPKLASGKNGKVMY